MSICNLPLLSDVCETVGEAPARMLLAPFDLLGQATAHMAQFMIETVWQMIDATTMVDVTTPEFVSVYNLLFGIGVFLALIFFFLQLVTGMIRRDPGALRYALFGLARALLGGFLAITLTATLLEIVDQLSIGLVQAAGETMGSLGDKIALLTVGLTGLSATAPGVTALLMIFLGFLTIAGVAILWFSLLIRKGLLLVSIVLAPLALSGTVWEATKGWVGKWIAFVVALAFSKLVIVVVFLVATVQLAAPVELDIASIADPLSGIALLLIAGFAPYMVYKLVSFIGFDLYQTMSAEQEAKAAINRPIPMLTKPPRADDAKKVVEGDGKSGKSGSTPKPGGPPQGSPSGPAATGGAGGGAAGGGAAGGGAAGGGAAAAGPAAAAVVGVQLVKGAAEAGPKAGEAVGAHGDAQAGAAGDQPATPSSSSPGSTPPSRNAPPTVTPDSGSGGSKGKG